MKKCLYLSGFFLLFCACHVFYSPTDYIWRFNLEEPKPSAPQTYSDEFIVIEFSNTDQVLGLYLQNKIDSEITINWEELFLTNPDGSLSRLAAFGAVKFRNKDKPQPPTVVPPNSKVSYNLFPPQKWIETSLTGRYLASMFNLEDNGKEFGLFFPLGIKGAKKLYDFKFRINISPNKVVKKQ